MTDDRQLLHSTDEHAANAPLSGVIGFVRSGGGPRGESSPHAHKFVAATLALLGIAVVALGVAIAALVSGGGQTATGPKWSVWSPPDAGILGERDIADQVAPFYRAAPATQLVVVTVRNVSATSTGTQLALRSPTSGSLETVGGTSAIFTLCGLGPKCAIPTGAPSAARLLLLRREALELALYTFKYVKSVDNVVAILPPGQTEPTGRLTKKPPASGDVSKTTTLDTAVVFQRGGLKSFLDEPLDRTLPEQVPPTVSEMDSAPEAELVSILTGQGLFSQQLVQAQDGSNVLVLSPLPPQ